MKTGYQIVTKFHQTHWNRGAVLFVLGSNLFKIDARSLQSTFILTVFDLPLSAFLGY